MGFRGELSITKNWEFSYFAQEIKEFPIKFSETAFTTTECLGLNIQEETMAVDCILVKSVLLKVRLGSN